MNHLSIHKIASRTSWTDIRRAWVSASFIWAYVQWVIFPYTRSHSSSPAPHGHTSGELGWVSVLHEHMFNESSFNNTRSHSPAPANGHTSGEPRWGDVQWPFDSVTDTSMWTSQDLPLQHLVIKVDAHPQVPCRGEYIFNNHLWLCHQYQESISSVRPELVFMTSWHIHNTRLTSRI